MNFEDWNGKILEFLETLAKEQKTITGGEMARIAENIDEVIIYLKPIYKGKNILIVYHDYI